MAKYTTEVRSICEHYAGLKEPAGYSSIRNIIEQARPHVFDFDYPIFDESYRGVLETKILKHYYTREIGLETVGLWKLKLDTKLNEIMPYYNQLYRSELIEFNPLYDSNLTTDYQKKGSGTQDDTGNAVGSLKHEENFGRHVVDDVDTTHKEDTTDNLTRTESTTQEHSGEHKITTSGSGDSSGTETQGTTEDLTRKETTSGSGEGKHNITGNLEQTTGGTLTGTGSQNKTVTDTGKDTTTGTDTEDSTTTLAGTNSHDSTTDTTGNNSRSGENWKLYSDTPQGGIENIEGYNVDGLTAGENMMQWLTNATRDTFSESGRNTGKETVKESGKDNSTTTVDNDKTTSRTVDKTNTETTTDATTSSETTTGTRKDTTGENKTWDETTSGTHNTTDNKTGSLNGSTTGEWSESGTDNKNWSDEGSGTHNLTDGRTIGVTGSGTNDRISDETGSRGITEGTTKDTTNNMQYTNLEDYIQHVEGKATGGSSYSKYLTEFRETFLNIDMEIIQDLNGLFMNLW